MKPLNKQFAPKSVMPEKVIQFGEGNFLRSFVDWIIWNMDQKTDFNGSVVVVQPIEKGMVDWLNAQDCLYHVNLQGRENGKPFKAHAGIDVFLTQRGIIILSVIVELSENQIPDFDVSITVAAYSAGWLPAPVSLAAIIVDL